MWCEPGAANFLWALGLTSLSFWPLPLFPPRFPKCQCSFALPSRFCFLRIQQSSLWHQIKGLFASFGSWKEASRTRVLSSPSQVTSWDLASGGSCQSPMFLFFHLSLNCRGFTNAPLSPGKTTHTRICDLKQDACCNTEPSSAEQVPRCETAWSNPGLLHSRRILYRWATREVH